MIEKVIEVVFDPRLLIFMGITFAYVSACVLIAHVAWLRRKP